MSNATSKQHDTVITEKIPSINDRLRKVFEKGIVNINSDKSASSGSASSGSASARASAQAPASADAMPLYKNQLIRWGGAALGSQVLRGAG